MTIKKLLRPQFMFPAVILILLIIALTLSALFPYNPFFKVIKRENASIIACPVWNPVSEEEFYQQMAIGIVAHVHPNPEAYEFIPADQESGFSVWVYRATIKEIIAQPRTQPPIQVGQTILISQLDSFGESENGDDYMLFLNDLRDSFYFTEDLTEPLAYYEACFKAFGYGVITPFVSEFRTELHDGIEQVRTSHLPDFLSGTSEYTKAADLIPIISAGRAKYGMSEYSETPA